MKLKDYCQYLTVTQTNYTNTYFADHNKYLSHDKINRTLKNIKCKPNMIWEKVKNDFIPSDNWYLLFDDSVVDKNFSHKIELVRKQYSWNAHWIIKWIWVVTCVYVNPELDRYWFIDMRIFNPDEDGKTKLDHMNEMLINTIYSKQLYFKTVLMDSWYATKDMMLKIEDLWKIYYCPIKKNRKVDDTWNKEWWIKNYEQICNSNWDDNLEWTDEELEFWKLVKIYKFPKDKKVKLFKVQVSTNHIEYIATNDYNKDQLTTNDTRKTCAIRWKIEQLHRECKQLTWIEKCQCRKWRIQRNHILASCLVWVELAKQSYEKWVTMYKLKKDLLTDYMKNQLINPGIIFR